MANPWNGPSRPTAQKTFRAAANIPGRPAGPPSARAVGSGRMRADLSTQRKATMPKMGKKGCA